MKLTYFMKDADREKAEAGLTPIQIAEQYWNDLQSKNEAGVMTDAGRIEYCTFINLKLAGMRGSHD